MSNTFNYHKELVDKRDYLMYNFAKEANLAKVNRWASLKDFAPVGKGRVMAVNAKRQIEVAGENKMSLLLSRILRASAPTSTALAKEKR